MPVALRNGISHEEIKRRIDINCARGLQQVHRIPGHDGTAVICAGGPSLARSLVGIGARDSKGACIVAANKASSYLIEHGIIPNCIALCAVEDDLVSGQQFAIDGRCTYLVSSTCHPSVFDALAKCEVLIWHASMGEPEIDWIKQFYPDPIFATSGTTVTLRSVDLLYAMGFRFIDIYGFDGSFEDQNGKIAHHAYEQKEDDALHEADPNWLMRVKLGDKEFVTRDDYRREAEQVPRLLQTYDMLWKAGMAECLKIRVHGDGLIPTYWRMVRRDYA